MLAEGQGGPLPWEQTYVPMSLSTSSMHDEGLQQHCSSALRARACALTSRWPCIDCLGDTLEPSRHSRVPYHQGVSSFPLFPFPNHLCPLGSHRAPSAVPLHPDHRHPHTHDVTSSSLAVKAVQGEFDRSCRSLASASSLVARALASGSDSGSGSDSMVSTIFWR